MDFEIHIATENRDGTKHCSHGCEFFETTYSDELDHCQYAENSFARTQFLKPGKNCPAIDLEIGHHVFKCTYEKTIQGETK